MSEAVACTCRPHSRSEYLAPLERQLAAEAALESIPAAVLTVIAEYLAPRLLLVMDGSICVVTRAPCALFSSAAMSKTKAQQQRRQQPDATALKSDYAGFTALHVFSMPPQSPGADKAFLIGGAALNDTGPAAWQRPGVGAGACLEDARRRVWVCVSLTAVGRETRLCSWSLTSAPRTGVDDCVERLLKRHAGNANGSGASGERRGSSTTTALSRLLASPVRAAAAVTNDDDDVDDDDDDDDEDGGDGADNRPKRPRQGRPLGLHPLQCGLHWHPGPESKATSDIRVSAVQWGDSLAMASLDVYGMKNSMMHTATLCGVGLPASLAPCRAGEGTETAAAAPNSRVDERAATDGAGASDAFGEASAAAAAACVARRGEVEWRLRREVLVDSKPPLATRNLAFDGRLYVYAFRITEKSRPQLRLYVAKAAAAATAAVAVTPAARDDSEWKLGWTAHEEGSVSHVPDLLVSAPTDASGALGVLALGGTSTLPLPAPGCDETLRCGQNAIAAAPDPLSEWTIRDWRLPFGDSCTAVAFADDWLYVVGAQNGAWATRWTPHHEGWTGPDWQRLAGSYKTDSAAFVVL